MTSWQDKGAAKRASLLSAIPPEWRLPSIPTASEQTNVTGTYLHQFLTQEEISITESTPTQILSNTTTGKRTAVSVATAFFHRAALAHQLTNALHEIFFDEGMKRAAELDAHFKETGKPMGPLHGLPISLKDSINVEGYDTTNGFIANIDKPATKDAELAKLLRSMGAILYVKTAVPQASFAGETENNIIGYTFNARNRFLSAGGSSGGEGALIAMHGSVLGIGSDIGGSIRHPAAQNGIFGLKPSYHRLPMEGVTRVMEGNDVIPFSWGPMSSSADGLTILMKAMLAQKPWLHDPRVVEIPWRNEIYEDYLKATKGGRQLVFGLMKHDGYVQPQPPITRALDMLVKKLESLGHKIEQWDPPSHREATTLLLSTWSHDGSQSVLSHITPTNEPILPSLSSTFGTTPRTPHTATQIFSTNTAIWNYRKRYMDYWNANQHVDAVLLPTYAYAGVVPGRLKYFGYVSYANVLDYSVGVIPVTSVDKSVDAYPGDWKPLSRMDDTVRSHYDAKLQHGAPVGISIFGRRYQDEKILGILEGLSSSSDSQGQGQGQARSYGTRL